MYSPTTARFEFAHDHVGNYRTVSARPLTCEMVVTDIGSLIVTNYVGNYERR